jgi:uncharacterized protein
VTNVQYNIGRAGWPRSTAFPAVFPRRCNGAGSSVLLYVMDVHAIDWERAAAGLWADGYACLPGFLEAAACDDIVRGYSDDALYRKTINMQAHAFGRGEYRYFAQPLPDTVAALRGALYARLAPVANAWNEALGIAERYPSVLEAFIERCAEAGQARPTPLVLSYGPGDFNCLHQDLYGEVAFPLQATIPLSARSEYDGGESVFVLQRPRAQSRAAVALPDKGDLLLFANRFRPARIARGFAREAMRHGVAEVRRGKRFALGIIFHDAR